MTAFEREETVRFAQCDPAGIVFFPQYLVMANNLVEEWFDRGLRIRYADLVGRRRIGLPTVRLEVDFTAVSRMGDVLVQRLAVEKLGRSSLTLALEFVGSGDQASAGQTRLRARQVLVCTSLETHLSRALPEDVRAAISAAGTTG